MCGCRKYCHKCDDCQSRKDKGLLFVPSNPGPNEPSPNEMFMFFRENCKKTEEIDRENTGGIGTGPGNVFPEDPLGSQSSVIVSQNEKFLFVVNAGDNTITSMRIYKDKIKKIMTVNSGGIFPVSLAEHNNLLYVLNAAEESNLSAFKVLVDGSLEELPITKPSFGVFPLDGTQPNTVTTPSQVGFNNDGTKLIVCVKENALLGQKGGLYVYDVNKSDGTLSNEVKTISEGFIPFSFIVKDNILVVDQIFGLIPNLDPTGLSAVSSYSLQSDNNLIPISSNIPNFQSAACWIARKDKYIYVSNTLSNNISSYVLLDNGEIKLLESEAAKTDIAPVDMVITGKGKYLYVVAPGTGSIQGFKICKNGSLKFFERITSFIPFSGVEGIAALDLYKH